MTGCGEGCKAGGSYNGTPDDPDTKKGKKAIQQSPSSEQLLEDIRSANLVAGASAQTCCHMNPVDITKYKEGIGDRVLCLDGGGIRGLVSIQILAHVERETGRRIRDCFDWIAGTSTGGLLTLAIAQGKKAQYGRSLFFRLKDKVFKGSRPYNTEAFEAILRKEFGETTRMSEVQHPPKILVSSALIERHPCSLHWFRNYDPPSRALLVQKKDAGRVQSLLPPADPDEQLVWRAARSSGAAPTYFRTCGRFADGGLIANNPTLDALTEIYNWGCDRLKEGQGQTGQVKPPSPGVVISVGTGKDPTILQGNMDVYIPRGVLDALNVASGAHSLMKILVGQATSSDGATVERGRAWCAIMDTAYLRLSPTLSEHLDLDCTDNSKLLRVLWETECYIYANRQRFSEYCALLTLPHKKPPA